MVHAFAGWEITVGTRVAYMAMRDYVLQNINLRTKRRERQASFAGYLLAKGHKPAHSRPWARALQPAKNAAPKL
jgi:hypothetical protein